MGSKHGSIHIKASDISNIIEQLKHNHNVYLRKRSEELKLARGLLEAFAGMTQQNTYMIVNGDVISLYNESFEFGRIETAAEAYSLNIHDPVFYSAVFDDDMLCCGIACNGTAERYGLHGLDVEDYGETPLCLRNRELCEQWGVISSIDDEEVATMDVPDLELALCKELNIDLNRTYYDYQTDRSLRKDMIASGLYRCIPWDVNQPTTPDILSEHERDLQENKADINRLMEIINWVDENFEEIEKNFRIAEKEFKEELMLKHRDGEDHSAL